MVVCLGYGRAVADPVGLEHKRGENTLVCRVDIRANAWCRKTKPIRMFGFGLPSMHKTKWHCPRSIVCQCLVPACSSAKINGENHTWMKKLIAVSYVAVPLAFSLGQTVNPGRDAVPTPNWLVERSERLSRRFPPDYAVPTIASYPATISRSYCVSPSPNKKSLSFKPCPTNNRLRLVPPLQSGAPATKP